LPLPTIVDPCGPRRPAAPDRRQALLGLGLIALAPVASLAASPAGAPAPGAPRALRLRAAIAPRRIGGTDAPESRLFRLGMREMDGQPPETGFPVFRVKVGDGVTMEIDNALDQPTSFHIRGLRGPNAADGIAGLTTTPIEPGATARITFPATQAGIFLIAPGLAARAAEQNARGLHAALIVEEANPPAFDHDLVLAVGDWRLDDKGVLAEDFLSRADSARVGRLGNRLAANGLPAPGRMTVRPGARLRIRMINVSNARVIPLKVSGFAAEVYSIDSTPCQPFDPLKRTVILAPNSRIEMVLQAPPEAGQEGAIEAKVGNGIPIFAYRTEGEPLPAKDRLAALPDPGLPPAIRLQDAVRADVAITGGIGTDPAEAEAASLARRFPDPRRVFTINGGKNEGFAGKPVVSVKRGKVLVLALRNNTDWPQVIAVHGHAFRLLHPFDDGWEPYFLDTLYMTPKTTARIALIADNPGKWAIRSTIAEHFGAGVATWFEVT
jgi:FtsP/CotA-like multicopper oxidase with cupredoxin domain